MGDRCSTRRGTTGRPKGINANCHTSTDAAPGMMPALLDFWMDADSVYLESRADTTSARQCG